MDLSVLILVCTVLVHIVICWIKRTKSLRQGNTYSKNSLSMVLSIVGTVPSPVNPLTDIVPHQVIPQYENYIIMLVFC